MTGLNLESFLHLLRADVGAWSSLAAMVLVLGLLTWTSWGSRRALRKCLVLSVAVHLGLAVYGGTLPIVRQALGPNEDEAAERERIREIKVAPWVESEGPAERVPALGRRGGRPAEFDRSPEVAAVADPALGPAGPSVPRPELELARAEPAPLAPDTSAPDARVPEPPRPEARRAADPKDVAPPPSVEPGDPREVPAAVIAQGPDAGPDGSAGARLRPRPAEAGAVAEGPGPSRAARAEIPAPAPPSAALSGGPVVARSREPLEARPAEPAAVAVDPEAGLDEIRVEAHSASPREEPVLAGPGARRLRPGRSEVAPAEPPPLRRPSAPAGPIAVARAEPRAATGPSTGGLRRRPLDEVPEVYRSRLGPNRSARAMSSGASLESEQAVERALDWLARHQDRDGRWDAGTSKFDDGKPVPGDDDYTAHCPAGEICFGECMYWEADTALTGLSLLAYLGAGYTHADGKYRTTVGRGLSFLLRTQGADGDLRGVSRAVGMYCHAMATLALCEALALTGDRRLREPAERAVRFLVEARARDGLSWRYAPRAPAGDTSILGWVVMALKSAREAGLPVSASIQEGTLAWLSKCAAGTQRGLAKYQPHDKVTPTMTAEAWACRQFLGVGGPGPSSAEAAAYLLKNGPADGPYNVYYWYYGTLAMYQHGGDAWTRWNAEARDTIVRHQRVNGHQAGSWDPDDTKEGTRGGRIYCTTMATLSLEVYYRFLRLYDAPKLPVPRSASRP